MYPYMSYVYIYIIYMYPMTILNIPAQCVRYQIVVWSKSRVRARGFLELAILAMPPFLSWGYHIIIICILPDNIYIYIHMYIISI